MSSATCGGYHVPVSTRVRWIPGDSYAPERPPASTCAEFSFCARKVRTMGSTMGLIFQRRCLGREMGAGDKHGEGELGNLPPSLWKG